MKHACNAASFVLVVLAVSCLWVQAQEPVPVTKNYVVWAHEFLRTMYPDLNGKKYFLSVEASEEYDKLGEPMKSLQIYVGEEVVFAPSRCCFGGYVGSAPPPENSHPWPRQLLKSGFGFDSHDRLGSFGADGSAIGNPEVSATFGKLAGPHPEWTDAEVNAALKKAGVKYGPGDKEQFIKDLPIQKLDHFLGKLVVISVELLPVDRNATQAWPWWEVKAKATQPDGAELSYKLTFEPSKGDLTDIVQVPNPFDRETAK